MHKCVHPPTGREFHPIKPCIVLCSVPNFDVSLHMTIFILQRTIQLLNKTVFSYCTLSNSCNFFIFSIKFALIISFINLLWNLLFCLAQRSIKPIYISSTTSIYFIPHPQLWGWVLLLKYNKSTKTNIQVINTKTHLILSYTSIPLITLVNPPQKKIWNSVEAPNMFLANLKVLNLKMTILFLG